MPIELPVFTSGDVSKQQPLKRAGRQWSCGRAARVAISIVAAVTGLWALAPPVEAYLDPGTGSTLLQGLIGTAAVTAGLVAHYWRRVRTILAPWWRRTTRHEA
jgi:hypothetical protein